MQQYHRHHAQILLAGVAWGHFALQILQEAVGKSVESAFAPGVLVVALPAVGTEKLDGVLLRIAVQSGPTGAAHPESFGILPFHRYLQADPRPLKHRDARGAKKLQ